jgi:hypothetical protein
MEAPVFESGISLSLHMVRMADGKHMRPPQRSEFGILDYLGKFDPTNRSGPRGGHAAPCAASRPVKQEEDGCQRQIQVREPRFEEGGGYDG